jgi:hypothetical protein
MAKIIFGLQQSLDGYVDHAVLGAPGPALFDHFVERVRALAGTVTYAKMGCLALTQVRWPQRHAARR